MFQLIHNTHPRRTLYILAQHSKSTLKIMSSSLVSSSPAPLESSSSPSQEYVPSNQLARTSNKGLYAKWIVFKAIHTQCEGHPKAVRFPVLSSSMSPSTVTYLIVTEQAAPYTPLMSEVMDSMWSWGIPESNPHWYKKVVTLLDTLFMDNCDLQFQRKELFYRAIKLEVEDICDRTPGGEFGEYVVLPDWKHWFHSTGYNHGKTTGYNHGKTFVEVAIGSFIMVEQECAKVHGMAEQMLS
jgi:hypothetical protein